MVVFDLERKRNHFVIQETSATITPRVNLMFGELLVLNFLNLLEFPGTPAPGKGIERKTSSGLCWEQGQPLGVTEHREELHFQ